MKQKNTLSKVISIVLLFTLLFYIIYNLFTGEVNAAYSSNRYTYNGSNLDTSAYPGFKERIDALQKSHPNWAFTIMETGLDWNQVITAETAGHDSSPLSLIQGKSGAWICSQCGDKTFDNNTWKHASEMAVRYYMDPRNWLTDNAYLFQFLQTDYINSTDDQLYNALANTFLHNKDYAKEINTACKEKNVNPYYVIARVIQEQGASGGATWKMEENGVTYYNLFNIGAGGNGYDTIKANALATAKANGWTSIAASIKGGVSTLSDYINRGQNTQYLNKFDVEPYGGTYSKQYMQNIEAPKNEASKMYTCMLDAGLLNQKLNFIIPVYKNMPGSVSQSPDGIGEIYPKNIRVKEGHSDVSLRNSPSTSGKEIYRIKDSSVVLLSVERLSNGWHKVVLVDGTWGYLKFDTSYLEEIDDLTNCYEAKSINADNVPMYVGPGSSQVLLTSLSLGQSVTRIDNTGRYTFGGTTWDRIALADGRQGFVERKYLSDQDASQIFTIRADGGLFLRSTAGSREENKIRLLSNGTQVTRIGSYTENGAEKMVDGYYWDYIITPDGAKGYVARNYLRDSNGNTPTAYTAKVEVEIKAEEKEIVVTPNANIDDIKHEANQNLYMERADGSYLENNISKTGDKVWINDVQYTVVKMGDCSGDGSVNIIDMALIKRDILDKQKLEGVYYKAAKVGTNIDGKIDIIDMAYIKRQILGKEQLTIR